MARHSGDGICAAIEHTRLAADTTPGEIKVLCDEAVHYGFVGVCVSEGYVALASSRLQGSETVVVSVVGFPLGACGSRIMAFAAGAALDDGAREVDMVIPVGLAAAGEWSAVEQHIRAVRRACGDYPLKVILETGYFSVERVQRLAQLATECGADFLKTSTGFGPRGASVEDVTVLAAIARGATRPVHVKASGGIRTLEQARALIAAGATRIGTSQGVAIAKEELGTGTSQSSPSTSH